MRDGRVNVLFESEPLEFRMGSVLLECRNELLELVNDYTWIFAGGTQPTAFLKSIGIEFGGTSVLTDTGPDPSDDPPASRRIQLPHS
jgi:hypothetical protein